MYDTYLLTYLPHDTLPFLELNPQFRRIVAPKRICTAVCIQKSESAFARRGQLEECRRTIVGGLKKNFGFKQKIGFRFLLGF